MRRPAPGASRRSAGGCAARHADCVGAAGRRDCPRAVTGGEARPEFAGKEVLPMRYKLTLRWRGTDYCGWQVQPGVATVCGTVQDAVERLFGRRGELTGCSRTDSGVHAAGFVAALGCAGCHIPPEALLRALNVNLPRDIAVTACEAVGEDFHPRYDAAAKRYRYRWYQSETRDPFREGLAVQLPRPVDAEAMDRAAKRLLGTHNFSAFCASGGKIPPEERVRTLTECAVTPIGDEIHLTVTGDGFLYNMVRIIAGTLLEIGQGRRSPEEMEAILLGERREDAGKTAPACGLYLEQVFYDKKEAGL